MKELASKISGSELEVLEVLWQAGEPLPVSAVRTRLEEERGWDGSTIKTLLRRLCEKGVVTAEKRGVFYYWPLLSREAYQAWSTRSLIQRVYQGSAKELVASLVRADQLTLQDLEELRAILEPEDRHG
ncbi:MAG: BlaI/MecI/CopY family transcriptional regulator [Lawsonibacter sp.]|nr:BlaI/MecI/CopY family transcriptional regulator [Lawsonibacter sp.]